MKRISRSLKIDPLKRKKSENTAPSDVSTVQDALRFIESANNTKKNKELLSKCFKIIGETSGKKGLHPEDILSLLDIIGCQKYGEMTSRKLIKCMVPSEHVPVDAAIGAISWICTQKLSLKTQVDLLKWILIVFKYIDEAERLTCIFGVIFHFIEYDILAPYACQLLCRLAEGYHVVTSRVKRLTELLSKLGPQPHILALLEVFRGFRPDLVSVRCNFKRIFKPLGVLPHILQQREHDTQKQKTAFIHRKMRDITQITYKDIKSFQELNNVMMNLKGPDNITKLIESPIRRILFTSYLPRDVLNQFCFWIKISLASEVPWKYDTKKYTRKQILNFVSDIATELQEGIPEAENFLMDYLQQWDGISYFNIILNIIRFWGICSFEDLQDYVLYPVYNHFCTAPLHYKCSVIECFIQLYKYWILWDIPRYQACKDGNATTSDSNSNFIFERTFVKLDPYREADALVTYIRKICVSALQLHPDRPFRLMHCILNFFETIYDVHSFDFDAPLQLPPPLVMCTSVFSLNAVTISQLCYLMTRFRAEVNSVRNRNIAESVPPSVISTFNTYIVNMCDMLWRCRAFSSTEDSLILSNRVPPLVAESVHSANDAFNISCHPAFLGFVYKFKIDIEKEISPKSIHQDPILRDAFLEFLSISEMKDVFYFIKLFIRK